MGSLHLFGIPNGARMHFYPFTWYFKGSQTIPKTMIKQPPNRQTTGRFGASWMCLYMHRSSSTPWGFHSSGIYASWECHALWVPPPASATALWVPPPGIFFHRKKALGVTNLRSPNSITQSPCIYMHGFTLVSIDKFPIGAWVPPDLKDSKLPLG